ncbi:hypothetical protein IVB02_27035 [Bradyrhizobium sp. 166]|uniref:hypothetical protein n=1 Tax=Bradyrhizobium sp. 166 TaxID=2782638 RepID=UPI001FFA0B4A|nr:hypothetical protein [Bradyrhizobium sp. 166]MCK1604956.1 hypothetical protein [Bradyrhizobium sp. 166]
MGREGVLLAPRDADPLWSQEALGSCPAHSTGKPNLSTLRKPEPFLGKEKPSLLFDRATSLHGMLAAFFGLLAKYSCVGHQQTASLFGLFWRRSTSIQRRLAARGKPMSTTGVLKDRRPTCPTRGAPSLTIVDVIEIISADDGPVGVQGPEP